MESDQKIEEMNEEELATLIASVRNLPFTLKIERVDGDKIYCRNSWGNHTVYIYKDNHFYIESELE